MNKKIVLFIGFLFCLPILVLAHQPRIMESNDVIVPDPEISKAYYAKLNGEPQFYSIKSEVPFDLYVNILVPDIKDQKTDVVAYILKINETSNQIIKVLDGTDFKWTKFFEPFGYDHYLMGPEYKAKVEAGEYEVQVTSLKNDSKYSLAIGEIENFNVKESINAINLIPKIKRDFFAESPINFILSFFGWGYILLMYIFSFIIGFIYRLVMKKLAATSIYGVGRNINTKDRIIRAVLGLIILILSITTTWNPILLFISGFCFFEAIFSWCGLYAALGKNSCPIE